MINDGDIICLMGMHFHVLQVRMGNKEKNLSILDGCSCHVN